MEKTRSHYIYIYIYVAILAQAILAQAVFAQGIWLKISMASGMRRCMQVAQQQRRREQVLIERIDGVYAGRRINGNPEPGSLSLNISHHMDPTNAMTYLGQNF